MGEVEPSFSSPSFNPSHPSDDFVAYSFSSLHRRVTPVPVHFGGRRSAVSSEDLLQGINTEDDETHVPMFQSISPVEHSEDADFATQETLLCHHDPLPPVVYPKAYYNSYYFPVVVHRMIDDVCNELGPELMHWDEEGDLFWIHQTSPKLGTVLKRYFCRTSGRCAFGSALLRSSHKPNIFFIQMITINHCGASSMPMVLEKTSETQRRDIGIMPPFVEILLTTNLQTVSPSPDSIIVPNAVVLRPKLLLSPNARQ